MRCTALKSARMAALSLLSLPLNVFGAGGEPATAIVFVADSRGRPGWLAWCINLYNEAPWQFTLLTVVIIPVTGVILGVVADFVMARSGINLKSRVLGEH